MIHTHTTDSTAAQSANIASKKIQTTYCVIELCPDGFVRACGPKHLQVKIINRPYTESDKGEILVEQLIESALPRHYLDVFNSGCNSRAIGNFRKITVKQLQETLHRLQIVQIAGNGLEKTSRNLLRCLEA